jgi:hypothetical protein
MEYIDEHRGIEAYVRIRDDGSIERFYRDFSVGTDENVDAFDGDVVASLFNEMVDFSVTTANVKNSSIGREEIRQVFGENRSPPV